MPLTIHVNVPGQTTVAYVIDGDDGGTPGTTLGTETISNSDPNTDFFYNYNPAVIGTNMFISYDAAPTPVYTVDTFLLVGRTGTGKTELAKAVARNLFDDPSAMIRVDCSEYALPHEYAKLIGSPPGYIGHNEGGFLTEAIKKKPNSVVLFDEVEKAHYKVHNLLLQLLDEAIITDSKGQTVSFHQALILMTSNLGIEKIDASLILIIGTIIIYRQLNFIQNSNIGFDKEQLLIVSNAGVPRESRRPLKNEISSLGGIVSSAFAGYLPISNSSRSDNTWSTETVMNAHNGFNMQNWRIDYDYIPTIGMQLLAGRNFSPEFGSDSTALIINERVAQLLGPGDA